MEDQDYSLFANISAEKRDVLGDLHRYMARETADARLTGSPFHADYLSRQWNAGGGPNG